jgi:ABC-type phosphate transport system substrate-binding protein
MKDRSMLVVLAIVALSTLAFVLVKPQVTAAPLPTSANAEPTANGAPAPQQYPIMDAVANKIIQKYQNSTCEQLWQEKAQGQGKPKSAQEQQAITILHNDPQMRAAFINKIAAPVANKMFECGMIP